MPARCADLTCRVGARARLARVTDDDFVDVIDRNARPLDRGARGDRAQLGRVHVLENAPVLADGRARGTQDHDGHAQPCPPNHIDIKRSFKRD